MIEKTSLGFVPLDGDGNPYRSYRGGYSWVKNKYKNPPKIYTTFNKAKNYSPVDEVAEVFMEREMKDEI